MEQRQVAQELQERSLGDRAVDGLIAGILAGLVMLVYLVLIGLVAGDDVLQAIGRLDPGAEGAWMTGLMTHLAISGIYGLIFSVAWSMIVRAQITAVRWTWAAGLLFGLLLFVMARLVLLDMVDSRLMDLGATHLLIAHLLYGLLLGLRLGRGT